MTPDDLRAVLTAVSRIAPAGLLFFGLCAGSGAACKKEIPPIAPAPAPESARLEVSSGAALLYTYADETGAFQTVDKVEAVPPPMRRWVRVVDPTRPPDERGDTDHVYAVDLTELERKSPVWAELVPRALYETRALAQLVPGASSALSDAPAGGAGDDFLPVDGGADGALAGAAGTALVTLYGTSWCGACRQARHYFVNKGIPFVDKDVEKDARAAAELQAKAARAGIAADRVPILDVAGRLLIGFDPARIERILGSSGAFGPSGANPI